MRVPRDQIPCESAIDLDQQVTRTRANIVQVILARHLFARETNPASAIEVEVGD